MCKYSESSLKHKRNFVDSNNWLLQSRDASWLGMNTLDLGMRHAFGYRPWVRRSVFELLWGYDEPLFKSAQYLLPDPPPFDR